MRAPATRATPRTSPSSPTTPELYPLLEGAAHRRAVQGATTAASIKGEVERYEVDSLRRAQLRRATARSAAASRAACASTTTARRSRLPSWGSSWRSPTSCARTCATFSNHGALMSARESASSQSPRSPSRRCLRSPSIRRRRCASSSPILRAAPPTFWPASWRRGSPSGSARPFVVENRPGASGAIGSVAVAKAPPDGYTAADGDGQLTHGINSALSKTLPYDPVKDFAPVTDVASTPNVLAVNPGTRRRRLSARCSRPRVQKPGALNFGSTSPGGSPHMSAELLKMMAGMDIAHVPYKGAGPMLDRPDRRADPDGLRQPALLDVAHQVGQDPRDRRHDHEALARRAGHPDDRRERRARLRSVGLVRSARAGGDAEAGRRRRSTGR